MNNSHPTLTFWRYFSLVIFTLICIAGCSPSNEAPIKKLVAEPTQTPTLKISESHDSTEFPDVIPTSTSQPAINDDWADLPELPTTEPAPQSHPVPEPTPTPGQPDISAPHTTFPSLPMPNAIWSAGILNGSPANKDAKFSISEYGPSDLKDAVIHIRDPAKLPAFLQPDQKIVLYLPGFPQGLYTVHVATTGGNMEDREILENRNQRLLAVRWNDHLIWKRWLDPFHSISSAVVPSHKVDPHSNQMVLENWGTHAIPIDAVWLSPYSHGENPFYVAMESAEWLNRKESKWIRTVLLELTPQSTSTVDTLSALPKRVPKGPPVSSLELLNRWEEARERYHLLLEEDPASAEELKPWVHAFSQAISRGMIPSVTLYPPKNSDTPSDLSAALYVFGDLVHSWFLAGQNSDPDLVKQLVSLTPESRVVSPLKSVTPHGAPLLRFQNASYDFRDQFYQGRQRNAYFAGELSTEELQDRSSFILNTKANFKGYIWESQPYHSFVFHRWVTKNLMANDYPVVVREGYPGGPFFPAGDDTPGLMWHYMKTLFRFGGPEYRKGLANLRGVDNSPEILDSSWAVADNGRDSVQVLVNSPVLLHGREAILELPLPWDGPTHMLHHHTTSNWKRPPQTPIVTSTERQQVEGQPIPLDASGRQGSWVRIQFKFQGHHLFEFYPEGLTENRNLSARESVGFSELQEVESLFHVSTSPPPPWWSRLPMGSHSTIRWNKSGNVEMDVGVDASKTAVPDWAVFKDIHGAIPEEYKAVTPLRDTSTRFHFDETKGQIAQVVRAGYNLPNTAKGETMGLWLKAEPPPGFQKKFNAFSAIPKTRFYMGNLPYRQLIEIEYGSWYFITSKAEWWVQSASRYDPALVFWPADPEEMNPIIEVNAFEVYQIKFEGVGSEKCLGFLQQDNKGNIQVLVLGVPGKPASWRQRLPFLVDEKSFQHVKDRELLTTADTPEEDPPDYVPHQIHVLEESKILEIDIGRMPAPPSPSHLALIEKLFPLLRNEISSRKVGVFLLETGGPKHD